MGEAVESALGDRIEGGAIAVKDGHLAGVKRVRLLECSHPVPDERGVAAAKEILGIAKNAAGEDLGHLLSVGRSVGFVALTGFGHHAC